MTEHNRKDPRAKVLSMTVRYRSATLNEFIEHHSYDVSRGGVFIKTPSPFPPGTLLKFEVKIADDQRVMQGVGRVVWKRDISGGKDEPTGMGIKFIKLDDASRAVIERLVASRGDDTMSAYDRSPDARAVEMFPTGGGFGSEDPTVIRPRDEVLAIGPSSESGVTGTPTMPVPSGPALSIGTPSGPLLSDPPLSLSMPDSLAAGSTATPASVREAVSVGAVTTPGRPTSRSIPRNPVTSEPPRDATSRGVLWITLVALVVGGGLAYVNWVRGQAPPPKSTVPAASLAPEVRAVEPPPEPEVPDEPARPSAPELEAAEPALNPEAVPLEPTVGAVAPPAEPPVVPPVQAIELAKQTPPKPKAQPKSKAKATGAPAPEALTPTPEPEPSREKAEASAPSVPAEPAPPENPSSGAEDEFQ